MGKRTHERRILTAEEEAELQSIAHYLRCLARRTAKRNLRYDSFDIFEEFESHYLRDFADRASIVGNTIQSMWINRFLLVGYSWSNFNRELLGRKTRKKKIGKKAFAHLVSCSGVSIYDPEGEETGSLDSLRSSMEEGPELERIADLDEVCSFGCCLDEREKKIAVMLEHGYTIREIAKVIKICETRAIRILKDMRLRIADFAEQHRDDSPQTYSTIRTINKKGKKNVRVKNKGFRPADPAAHERIS